MLMYQNNKTKRLYLFLGYGLDCTNDKQNEQRIIYMSIGKSNQLFMREEKEFFNKFTEIKT